MIKKKKKENKNKQPPLSKEEVAAQKRRIAAAVTIQTSWRCYSAVRQAIEEKRKKVAYEEEMERLEREAYANFARMQREQDQKEMAEMLEKRRRLKEQEKNETAVRDHAFEGELELLVSLLEGHDLNVDAADAHGDTPLSEAAASGAIDVMIELIKRGADVNSRGRFDRTPLYRACFAGHTSAALALLEAGADPRLYDAHGERPGDVCANDDTKTTLEGWDISRTEALLADIEARRHAQLAADRERRASAKASEADAVAAAQTRHDQAQSRLRKAYAVREKRYLEYDEQALACHTEKMEIAEKMIKDALRECEEAQIAATVAQQELQAAKQRLRALEHENRVAEAEAAGDDEEEPRQRCNIRELDEVVMRDAGGMIEADGRWPLLIDFSQQVATFLRYRDTNYVNICSPEQMSPDRLRLALLGAIRFGKPLVLDMMDCDAWASVEECFTAIEPDLLDAVLAKDVLSENRWESLIRDSDGESYKPVHFVPARMEGFRLYVVTQLRFPDPILCERLLPIEVVPSGAL